MPHLHSRINFRMAEDMIDSVALASAYRLQAVNFRLSAEKLSATMETKKDGTPARLTAIPFYFLVSHSAELLLKSALLKRGFTESDLKRYNYRHNLNSLLAALQKKGVSVTLNTVNLINGLHSQHQLHIFRYNAIVSIRQKLYLPPAPLLFAMLDELLELTAISVQGV